MPKRKHAEDGTIDPPDDEDMAQTQVDAELFESTDGFNCSNEFTLLGMRLSRPLILRILQGQVRLWSFLIGMSPTPIHCSRMKAFARAL